MSDVVEELLAKIFEGDTAPQAKKEEPAPVVKKSERPVSRFNPPPLKAKPAPRVTANRVVRAPAPPPANPDRPPLPGRPAPTPASAVVGTQRVAAPAKGDYRAIRF